MQLPPGGRNNGQAETLAISIIAVTGTREALPPHAFARITIWSHGRGSKDSSACSEWPDAQAVVLPIGGKGDLFDKEIELEVSFWEKIGDVSRMFDASTEINLPPPSGLDTSEQAAVER